MSDRCWWLACCSIAALSVSVGCALPHAAVRGSEDATGDGVSDVELHETTRDIVARDQQADVDSSISDVFNEELSIDDRDAREAGDASDGRSDVAMIDGSTDAGESGMDAAIDGSTDTREAGMDAGRDASDAARDVSCSMGQSLCSTGCVDTRTHLQHCGMCEHVCPSSPNGTATCESGLCALRCNPGYRYTEAMGSPSCVEDTTSAADSCPGQRLDIAADRSVTVVGTTLARRGMRTGSMACDALTGPEVYYQVVSRAAGTLHITLTSFEPLGLYALSGMCTDGALGSRSRARTSRRLTLREEESSHFHSKPPRSRATQWLSTRPWAQGSPSR